MKTGRSTPAKVRTLADGTERVMINFWAETELHGAVVSAARKEKISVSNLIRDILFASLMPTKRLKIRGMRRYPALPRAF